MTLVERIEAGMTNSDDAIIVRRLIAALAKMMIYAPSDIRRSEDYNFSAFVLADAVDLRSKADFEY
jgi:hypothetical protein